MRPKPGVRAAMLLAAALAMGLAGCSEETGLFSLLTPTFTLPPTAVTPTPSATATDVPLVTPIILPTFPADEAERTVSPSLTLQLPGDTPADVAVTLVTATPTSSNTPGPGLTASHTPDPLRSPTRTPIPTRTRWPSMTPTISPTPLPPVALFQIGRPGLLSRVTSPINAEIYAVPGPNGIVRVQLIGEDGRTIFQDDVNLSRYVGRSVAFYPSIPFQIQSMAETARLQATSYDGNGRMIGVASVQLVLLSLGRAEIYAADNNREPFAVWYPKEEQEVSGGVLSVNGLMRPVNDSPLTVTLIAEDGRVVARRDVDAPPAGGAYEYFYFELPYQVSEPTNVRLTFSQADERIPGLAFLNSRAIVLLP